MVEGGVTAVLKEEGCRAVDGPETPAIEEAVRRGGEERRAGEGEGGGWGKGGVEVGGGRGGGQRERRWAEGEEVGGGRGGEVR
jgi:hypothetical protein